MTRLLSTAMVALGIAATLPAAPAAAQANPQMGQIIWVGFNFCPRNFLPANGALLPIAQNTALFSLYGTIYGGDGRTTFGLPDLQGRAPVGQGNGPGLSSYRQGQKTGTETNTMTNATMPSHTHSNSVMGSTTAPESNTPNNAALANGTHYTVLGAANADFNANSVTIANTGSSLPFNNMQPFLAQYPCVAVQGTYPSRS